MQRYSKVPKDLRDAMVMLYKPHPGIGGASMPLPKDIKETVDELAKIQEWGGGKLMSLQEAFIRLKSIIGDRGELTIHMSDELFRDGKYFKRGYFILKITEEKDTAPENITIGNKTFVPVPDEDGKFRCKHSWCLIWFVEDVAYIKRWGGYTG